VAVVCTALDLDATALAAAVRASLLPMTDQMLPTTLPEGTGVLTAKRREE